MLSPLKDKEARHEVVTVILAQVTQLEVTDSDENPGRSDLEPRLKHRCVLPSSAVQDSIRFNNFPLMHVPALPMTLPLRFSVVYSFYKAQRHVQCLPSIARELQLPMKS